MKKLYFVDLPIGFVFGLKGRVYVRTRPIQIHINGVPKNLNAVSIDPMNLNRDEYKPGEFHYIREYEEVERMYTA